MTIQSERSSERVKFINTSKNNWKPLFEVNFTKNSAKTIRLFALDFYEVIVDSAFGPPHPLSTPRNLELII